MQTMPTCEGKSQSLPLEIANARKIISEIKEILYGGEELNTLKNSATNVVVSFIDEMKIINSDLEEILIALQGLK